MSNIYETTDNITPMVSFHKSVTVNGGIIANSASLGNSQCKLVVNNDGIYIVVPSKFDNNGSVSETNYRQYNLGAMVEAIQELNRRTAWMETDMTFSESLNGTDVIKDTTMNSGAMYNDRTDLLPGLKLTVPDGNHFALINTNGEAIRFYQTTNADTAAITSEPLLTTSNNGSLSKLNTIMENDKEYTSKYISPRILNKTDNSFELLVLDIVFYDSVQPPTLSDGYYIYTPIGGNEYKASLKDGITINAIITNDDKIIPPVPYICTFSEPTTQSNVTSIAELFKERTLPTDRSINFSDWDFSRITNMSNIFEGCNSNFTVKWTNEGYPGFIRYWKQSPAQVVLDKNGKLIGVRDNDNNDIDLIQEGLSVSDLTNFIWKDKDGNWFRFSHTKGDGSIFGMVNSLTVSVYE